MSMMKFLFYRIDERYNLFNKPISPLKIIEKVAVTDSYESKKVVSVANIFIENNCIYAIADIDEALYGKLSPHPSMCIDMNKDGSVKLCVINGVKLKKEQNPDPEIKSILDQNVAKSD